MFLPKVSIIIPVKNAERTIEATLESVARQTYTNWELILTDDQSRDHSRTVIASWAQQQDKSVQLVNGHGRGPSSARNLAVSRASGSYLAFLDADDLWSERKIEEQIKWLRANLSTAGAVTCGYDIVNALDMQSKTRVHFDWSRSSIEGWAVMEGKGPALCSTLIVDYETFDKVGGFNESLTNLEDLDLALKLCEEYEVGCVDEVLCQYVIHSEQNHRNLSSVKDSFKRLSRETALFQNQKILSRAEKNFELYFAFNEFRINKGTTSLLRLLQVFARSPLVAARTIAKRSMR